jgi:integrase/recombinase XerD
MNGELRIHPQPRSWWERSVLGPHLPDYCSYLRQHRYAARTSRSYVYCVAHFAHWIHRRRMRIGLITEDVINRFLLDHLPKCQCPDRVRRGSHETRTALRHLLKVLRSKNAIRPQRKELTAIERELARFDCYMDQTRGLAENTRKQRVLIVRRFLAEQFGSGRIAPGRLQPADIRSFMAAGKIKGWSAASSNVIGGALRCYLRFRATVTNHVERLIDAVPRAACWRLANIPDVLSDAQIDQLLASFDQPFPSAARSLAIVRCVVDLGLRSSEVVRLRIDDIDWRAGIVSLTRSKSRRVDILPLPAETGRAIARYLKEERPATSNRALFVRHCAPYDQPIGPDVVRQAVRAAYRRCGWTRSRVHILRHSLASRLLKSGGSLKEIADVLRHRDLDTSAIDTKVDFNRLAAVALPWPGRAS